MLSDHKLNKAFCLFFINQSEFKFNCHHFLRINLDPGIFFPGFYF